MIDFDVKRSTRVCSATGRALASGEKYFTALVADGAEVRRQDYSAEAWSEPPAGTIGWWKAEVTDDAARRPKMAPKEVALELFDRWSQTTDAQDAAYLLALFLVRKRVFQFIENAFETPATDEEQLQLHCPSRSTDYTVPVIEIPEERAAEIQQQFVELLYADAA